MRQKTQPCPNSADDVATDMDTKWDITLSRSIPAWSFEKAQAPGQDTSAWQDDLRIWQDLTGTLRPERPHTRFLQQQHVSLLLLNNLLPPFFSIGTVDGKPVTAELVYTGRYIQTSELQQLDKSPTYDITFRCAQDCLSIRLRLEQGQMRVTVPSQNTTQDLLETVCSYLATEAALWGGTAVLDNKTGYDVALPAKSIPARARELSAEDWGELKLRMELSPENLRWTEGRWKRGMFADFHRTHFSRNASLFLAVESLLRGQAVQRIGVFGLGCKTGMTHEAYELASLFPDAVVTGFDKDILAVELLQRKGELESRLTEEVQHKGRNRSETYPELAEYLARFQRVSREREGDTVLFDSSVTDRVSGVPLDFLEEVVPVTERFDVVTCLNSLLYLLMEESSTLWVKAFVIQLLAALKPGGVAVLNTADKFAFPFTNEELAVLGVVSHDLSEGQSHALYGDVAQAMPEEKNYHILQRRNEPSPLLHRLNTTVQHHLQTRGADRVVTRSDSLPHRTNVRTTHHPLTGGYNRLRMKRS